MSNSTLTRPTSRTTSVRRVPGTVGSYTGTASAVGSYTGTASVAGSFTGTQARVLGSYLRTQR